MWCRSPERGCRASVGGLAWCSRISGWCRTFPRSTISLCRCAWRESDIVERGKRSEEHTSELQSLMRISYAVFCLKKKKQLTNQKHSTTHSTLTLSTTQTPHKQIPESQKTL